MTLFSIYAKPEAGPDALIVLPDRFSWTAFVFTPLWAIVHGTVLFALVWVAVVLGLRLGAPRIGGDTALALYALFALWSGFAAPQIAAKAMEHRRWMALGEVSAPSAPDAERIWLGRRYGVGA